LSEKMKVVLIANDGHPIPSWVPRKLAEANLDYSYHDCFDRHDLQKYASDADILWLMSSREGLVVEANMDIFPKVGMAIKCGSGTDNIDHAACTKRGIIVGHTPDDPTDPASDHTIAMLFTAVRQTARQDRLIRRGIWDQRAALPLAQLSGANLGLIGFGRIGQAVVRKLSGFQMIVRIYDPYLDESIIQKANAARVDLDQLLQASQFIIVACPLNAETRNLIGEKEVQIMRPDAVLVNCSRAGIVDEKAVRDALKEKRIKAAAFDVLEKHPLEPGDEWLQLENVNFTPHLAGHHADYPNHLFDAVVDVIIDVSNGHLPRWIANQGVKPKWDLNQ
jgi:D-3-phosphoglycerate dehydrogenase